MVKYKTLLMLFVAILLIGYWSNAESSMFITRNDTGTKVEPRLEDDNVGWIVALKDKWFTFVDEPEEHFRLALKNFHEKKMDSAGHEVKKARAIIRMETYRVIDSADSDLLWSAVDKLSSLVKRIANGEVKSDRALKDVFAQAHYALAKHHYNKADRFWQKDKHSFAGKDLAAADINLNHSLEWIGYIPDTHERKIIKKARVSSAKLIEDKISDPFEIVKVLNELGQIVEELGNMRPLNQI